MELHKLVEIIEANGFSTNYDDAMFGEGKPGMDITQYTPLGEDWYETIEADDAETFVKELERRIDGWDSEDEAMPYIEMRGQNGVPSSIRDLLEDADWKLEQLTALLNAIKNTSDEKVEESEEIKESAAIEIAKVHYDEVDVDRLRGMSKEEQFNDIFAYLTEVEYDFCNDVKDADRNHVIDITIKELESLKDEYPEKVELINDAISSFEELKYEEKLQEDDEEGIDSESEEQEEELDEVDELIQDWMDKSPLHSRVISEIVEDSENYDGETKKDRIAKRLDDVMHGLVTGIVSSMIYYTDTVAFYNEYEDDIYDLVEYLVDNGLEPLEMLKQHHDETEIIMQTDTVKNRIAWLAYEEIAYMFGNELGVL